MKVVVKNCGAIGVIKDLSVHELPVEAWTDALDVRFLDGYAYQMLGYNEVYDTPAYAPQFVMQVNVAGAQYWLYATAAKCFVVTNSGGVTTHTDITHLTARAGVVNQWSGFVFSGIPVLNVGDTTRIPMYWDQNLTHKFLDLPAWPAGVYAYSLASFKGMIIAINVTKAGVNYPYMIKWSHPAVPGALPTSYDETDATKDAGEFDLVDGQDAAIWALGLKDDLIVYKKVNTYAIAYVGGQFILKPRKIFGMSGIMNRNCAVDLDTMHFVVTASDIIMHDGYSATSVLDKRARRNFFQSIDVASKGLVHCVQNPFLNEVQVNYPAIGSSSCDRALVYNYVDKTVTFRTIPNINHAAYGPIDTSVSSTFDSDSDPFDSDLTAFNGPEFTPDATRVLMASANTKLYMLDASASNDGALPAAFVERRGLSLDMPDRVKCVTGIRPQIAGNDGETVGVLVGYADSPYADPTYTAMEYVIGSNAKCSCEVSGAFIAVRYGTGTAYQWRLDSYILEFEDAGAVEDGVE